MSTGIKLYSAGVTKLRIRQTLTMPDDGRNFTRKFWMTPAASQRWIGVAKYISPGLLFPSGFYILFHSLIQFLHFIPTISSANRVVFIPMGVHRSMLSLRWVIVTQIVVS